MKSDSWFGDFFKTRVYKHDDRWWVDYVFPYSGRLTVDFATWDEAYADACKIETDRMWI